MYASCLRCGYGSRMIRGRTTNMASHSVRRTPAALLPRPRRCPNPVQATRGRTMEMAARTRKISVPIRIRTTIVTRRERTVVPATSTTPRSPTTTARPEMTAIMRETTRAIVNQSHVMSTWSLLPLLIPFLSLPRTPRVLSLLPLLPLSPSRSLLLPFRRQSRI